ncbi:cupin domain-containing protein [Methylocapsa aurea]|uniref:cupin domain-containing protein n=1 Tax=Methylocapsa aurea TaxID=663610 RepID=UPI00055FA760|nr:cupin domain-containing protein [Methylocapsa aurea]
MQKLSLFVTVAILGASPVFAEETGKVVAARSLEWADAPAAFPKGAKAAVISGDPTKEGLFVIRLKLPADYKIPAHQHPTTEFVTVLDGVLYIGMGDKLDASKGQGLSVGDFAEVPATMSHYAWTTGPTTIQVHGQGPVALTYVNPMDDPRK